MSSSTKGRSTLSKDIIEEVVTPLVKHLEIAEKRAVGKNKNDEAEKMFKQIGEMVESKKDNFGKRKDWEDKVIDTFSVVEQHIDNILEDGDQCDTNKEFYSIVNKELNSIVNELEKMAEKVIPSQEHHEEFPSSSLEKGETSDTSTNEQEYEREVSPMPFIDEIIDTLDPQLRHCLYFVFIFPENSVIKRRLLVYWWIALKLVRLDGEYTAEQIGGLLFDDLVDKGILIPFKTREHNKVVDQCTIQPIIHKKLISSARRKRFILEGEEIKDSNLKICTIRKNRLNVGTILNVNEKYLKSDDVISKSSDEKKISDVKNIAVMQVGQWKCVDGHHIEIDKTDFFNEPIPNLTYLSLQNISRIRELPEPIGNSTSLMILDLRACHNLEKLPLKIKSLKNHTHLDVSMCYLLDHIPKWIHELGNLEVLKGFVIGSSGNKNRCRLSDLSRLSNLRKLGINISHDSEVSTELSNLERLSNLRSLTITWGIEEKADKPENGQVKVENPTLEQKEKNPISPPVNIFPEKLEKLDLKCFPRAKALEWLTPTALMKLKRLYIRGGNLDGFSSNKTEQDWEVEILRLRFLKKFEMEWNELRHIFPKINCVEHDGCDKLDNKFLTTKGQFWFRGKKKSFLVATLLRHILSNRYHQGKQCVN